MPFYLFNSYATSNDCSENGESEAKVKNLSILGGGVAESLKSNISMVAVD